MMGGSGGGPFALACAHLLPKPMISSVGLFASAGPREAGPQHMSWVRRMMSLMSVYWPSGLQILLTILVRGFRLIATSGPAIKRIDAWLEAQGKKAQLNRKDEEVADENSDKGNEKKSRRTIEKRRNYLLQLLIEEPFAQGVDATVLEARLLTAKSWGFKFEDVEFNPVRIWHGTKDANSPIAVIRYLARRLP